MLPKSNCCTSVATIKDCPTHINQVIALGIQGVLEDQAAAAVFHHHTAVGCGSQDLHLATTATAATHGQRTILCTLRLKIYVSFTHVAKWNSTCEDLQVVQIQPCGYNAFVQQLDFHCFSDGIGRGGGRARQSLLHGEPHVTLLRGHLWIIILFVVHVRPQPVQIRQHCVKFEAFSLVSLQFHRLLRPCGGQTSISFQEVPQFFLFKIVHANIELMMTPLSKSFEAANLSNAKGPATNAHDAWIVTPGWIAGVVSNADLSLEITNRHDLVRELLCIQAHVQHIVVPESARLRFRSLVIVTLGDVVLQRKVPLTLADTLVLHAFYRQPAILLRHRTGIAEIMSGCGKGHILLAEPLVGIQGCKACKEVRVVALFGALVTKHRQRWKIGP
mmetsp:Transcript_41073/g.64959  ORF Transcript_41073/g.64959 Transcript_41073/m.64959 type:complete len:388 (-) Transcript_41073:185-1348(-)